MIRRPIIGMLIGLGLGLLAVLLLVSVLQTRGLAGAIRETQKVNTGTVDLIRDCTQPSGKCFRKARERTAKVVLEIGERGVLVEACADLPGQQTEVEIRACVERLTAEGKDKP